MAKEIKKFRVVSISNGHNSFGLTGHILVSRSGEAWEVGRCRLGDYPSKWFLGQDIDIATDDNGRPNWPDLSCEIPRQLPACPSEVLSEIFSR